MSFRTVTTTLSSLRTTTCDALIVPSAYIECFYVLLYDRSAAGDNKLRL